MKEHTPVYIVDKLVIGHNHVMFNAAMTAIIAGIFKDRENIFIAEKLHSDLVKEINRTVVNLSYRSFDEAPLPESKFKKIVPWIRKKAGDFLFIKRFYSILNKREPTVVFFTCLSASSLVYASYKSRQKNVSAIFVLHGEVEFMFKKDIRLADRIKGMLYRATLRNINKSAKCIVLAEMIKTKLCERGLIEASKVIAIEHPIIQKDISYTSLGAGPVVFGHIGIAMEKKNSAIFFTLASFFEKEIQKGNTAFQLLGKAEPALIAHFSKNVQVMSENNNSIAQKDYQRLIEGIGYAVFTFDNRNYVFRVSGSLMDAIFYRKPVIALRQDYMNYLFETGGNIGFLCNDIEEMEDIISRLIRKEESLISQYALQQKNLGLLMKKFSDAGVKQELTKQLFD
jgi:hypothetical protein